MNCRATVGGQSPPFGQRSRMKVMTPTGSWCPECGEETRPGGACRCELEIVGSASESAESDQGRLNL